MFGMVPNSQEGRLRLSEFLAMDAERRRLECARVIENLQILPTTQSVRDDLVMLGPVDVNIALRRHPGYLLERKIESVRTMLELFLRALDDLKKAIETFPSFRASDERTARERFEHEVSVLVNKELFTVLAAAQTLVDYSRRVKGFVDTKAFESRRDASFNPQEHKLVIELRNIVIHQVHSEANWQTVYRFGGQPSTTHFVIDREDLLADGSLSSEAMQHLATLGEQIDIIELLSKYAERVTMFYGWLLSEIESNLPSPVADYRACQKAWKVHQLRAVYRIALNSWIREGVDPYKLLPKYLTAEQFEGVSDFPHRSAEQVDYIITCVDRDEACDESLRNIVYEFFKIRRGTTHV